MGKQHVFAYQNHEGWMTKTMETPAGITQARRNRAVRQAKRVAALLRLGAISAELREVVATGAPNDPDLLVRVEEAITTIQGVIAFESPRGRKVSIAEVGAIVVALLRLTSTVASVATDPGRLLSELAEVLVWLIDGWADD